MTPDLIGAYAAAGCSLIGAVALAFVMILGRRETVAKVAQVGASVARIEVSVNGNMTTMSERVAQLTAALTRANVDVPVPPPAPAAGPPAAGGAP